MALAHGAPVSQAQTLGAQHPAVAALFGAQGAPGRRRQRARALASSLAPADDLTAFLKEWGLEEHEADLRGIGVDDVRTLGTFEEHVPQLEGHRQLRND